MNNLYINEEGYLEIQRPEYETIYEDGIAIAQGEVLKRRKYKVNTKTGLFEEVK